MSRADITLVEHSRSTSSCSTRFNVRGSGPFAQSAADPRQATRNVEQAEQARRQPRVNRTSGSCRRRLFNFLMLLAGRRAAIAS